MLFDPFQARLVIESRMQELFPESNMRLRREEHSMKTNLFQLSIALVLSIVVLVTVACATGPATPALDTDTAAMQQPAPEEAVQEFYTWYLDFIGDRSSGEFRNPLVERAYRDAPNLSTGFVEQMDTLLDTQTEELGGIPADPFLCAQDIPERVDVAAISDAGSGIDVEMQSSFENHTWTVHVEPVDGNWLITDIRCAPTDEPATWTEPYPPFNVEISVGALEEYRRMYIEPTSSETITINDVGVALEQHESGAVTEMRYIFQHPENEDLRVTVVDWMSGFPVRVEGNESVMAVLDQVLTTVTFTQ